MGRSGRLAPAGEGVSLVARVVTLAVRRALDQEWSAEAAARTILDLTTDVAALRRARARVSEVVLTSPSIAGTHALAALNLALARLQDSRVPVQRAAPSEEPREPHDLKVFDLTGSPESRRDAALFVAANVCPEHGPLQGGRAMLLAQELLAQTVGQSLRAAQLVLACTGHTITLSVDLTVEHAALQQLRASTPDLTLVQVLADDCGVACLRPGVRYWASIAT